MSSISKVRSQGRALRDRSIPPGHAGSTYPVRRSRSAPTSFFGVATKNGTLVSGDILDQFAYKQESQQLTSSADMFRGVAGLVQPLYDPISLSRHMEVNTYHARCVRTKAQDTAGNGWELVPLVDNPSDDQQALIEQFFEDLEVDIQEILVQAMTDRESIGWLTIEVARENKDPEGTIVLLKNIPSHTMRAHLDGKRYVQERSSKRVWFKKAGLFDIDVHKLNGDIVPAGELDPEMRANEVMWNNIYTARSDIYGVPDHIPAIGAILGDVSRRDYNIAFFDNFGVPAYAVSVSGDYDPGEAVNDDGLTEDEDPDNGPYKSPLHREIEAHLQEVANNPHSVLLLSIPSTEGGEVEVKFTKLAVEIREASFRLYREDNMKEVLSAHAVPPYRAGIAEQGSLGGNVAENMDEIYRDSVLEPRQSMLNRLINKYVLASMEITDWTFRLLSINVEDQQRDLNLALDLFDHAALTPNDLIRNFCLRYDVEPSENPAMDAHYLNGVALDTVLPSDLQSVMMSLRDNLLEIARKHVESGDEDGTLSAEFLGVLAGLEASTAAATASRESAKHSTAAGAGQGNGSRHSATRRLRVRTDGAGPDAGRLEPASASNGDGYA